jgi:hypothetical protein
MVVVCTQAQQAAAIRQALLISSERASHSQLTEELLRDDEQVPGLLVRGHAPELQDGGGGRPGWQQGGFGSSGVSVQPKTQNRNPKSHRTPILVVIYP